MAPFGITIWHRGPTSYVICQGELDRSTSQKLQDAVEMVLDTSPRLLHLDCRGVRTLNASGVDALVNAAAQAVARQTEMKLQLNEGPRLIASALCGDEVAPWEWSPDPNYLRPSLLSFLEAAPGAHALPATRTRPR